MVSQIQISHYIPSELERLLEMKEVAEEENLVALKSLILTAEKVMVTNYKAALKSQVSLILNR